MMKKSVFKNDKYKKSRGWCLWNHSYEWVNRKKWTAFAKNGEWGYNMTMTDTVEVTNVKIAKREGVRKMSQDLKCLANEHRLAIVLYLKNKKSASVGEISDNLSVSFKATSKHLLYLVKKGILICHSDNPFVIYSLNPRPPELVKKVISFF